jgi:hypothetical protein
MTERAVSRISGCFGLAAVVVFAVELNAPNGPWRTTAADDPGYRTCRAKLHSWADPPVRSRNSGNMALAMD